MAPPKIENESFLLVVCVIAIAVLFKVPMIREWLYSLGLFGRIALLVVADCLVLVKVFRLKSKSAKYALLFLTAAVNLLYLCNEFGCI